MIQEDGSVERVGIVISADPHTRMVTLTPIAPPKTGDHDNDDNDQSVREPITM